jgi:dTDP-glucose 4,6-dehydratase
LLALTNGRTGSTITGARNERRNIDVVHSVLDSLGKPRSLISYVTDRPGHDRRYAIDPTGIETELGWRPCETWESGLQKTIEWYRQNSGWLQRVRSGAYREYYARQYGAEAGVR